MNIVFLGTPDFAAEALDSLLHSRHRVLAVVTQPDKPRGRGNSLQASPVKMLAAENGITVLQFNRIRTEGEEPLRALKPDIMVTCAYGQILTQNILDIAKHGIINVHASLLPKYRGAAPIQWSIINGDRYTGVTIMQTERGIDTGDILYAEKLPIGERETAGELFSRLAALGGKALLVALELIECGKVRSVKQNDADATHVKTLQKSDGLLDWSKSAVELFNLIRGVNPWPGAYSFLNGKLIKIWESTVLEERAKAGKPGTVLKADAKAGLSVACGGGILQLDVIQESSAKRLPAKEYLKGKKVTAGSVFGNE